MSDSSINTQPHSNQDDSQTLDEAIQHCVLALEQGETDPGKLIEKFPQWQKELVEFLQDWGGMERYAFALRAPLPEPRTNQPTHFGDYELLEKIGVGGMGIIYKARQISLDRIVAIKMLQAPQRDRDRFLVEAETAAALSHPHIVSIYEIGEHRGSQFFSMQFIEGCNLKEYVDINPIPPREAARILCTIAEAVHYAHRRGILHRDLKPANIMMDVNGQPHITDFGLAKQIERDTEITRTGTIMGTPGYMSPEQADGKNKNLTIATDVYGLGAILYALLTGDAPFVGNSSLDILQQVVNDSPVTPRSRRPEIERDLETICLKCLEKAPELRYSSPQRMADDLTRFLNNEPVTARPVSSTERVWRWCRRNPMVAILSFTVVALLVATTVASVFLAMSERDSHLQSQKNIQQKARLNRELSSALKRANRERANLLMANGLWQASNHNVGEALLWFSTAANMTDPTEVNEHLVRFQSWLRKNPMPVAATMLDSKYCNREQVDQVFFQPQGSSVLYQTDRHVMIWDYTRNHQWHVTDSFPNLTRAIWSPDGKSIVISLNDGQILLVDVHTRQSEILARAKQPVTDLTFVNREQWLAFNTGNSIRFVDVDRRKILKQLVTRERSIEHLAVNSQGTCLVVVSPGQSVVFSLENDLLKERFQFRCHYKSVLDRNHRFWPMFVKNDKVLLVRTEQYKTVTLDPNTGKQLGTVPLVSPTYCVAISSDGESFVTGTFNYGQHYRFSRLRAPPSPKQTSAAANRLTCSQHVRFSHDHRVRSVAIGPDGLVVTAGQNGQVKLWKSQFAKHSVYDVPEKEVPVTVLPHTTQVRRVALTPDGKHLLTIQIDGLVRMWKIPSNDTNGYRVRVQPGGSLVKKVGRKYWLIAGMSKWSGHMENATVLRMYDGAFVKGLQGLSIRKNGHLLDSAVSPDQKQLATVHAGQQRGAAYIAKDGRWGILQLWRLSDGKPLHDPIRLPAEPRWVTYHPNQDYLAVCTCEMEVVIVDTTTFKIQKIWKSSASRDPQLLFPANAINERIAFSPDGKSLLRWGSRRPGLEVLDFETGELRFPKIANENQAIGGLDFSPDGKRIAIAGGRNPTVRVFDLESGEFVGKNLLHAAEVHSARFSPDGKSVVTGCRDGHARIFDWKSGELRLKEMTHEGSVVNAVFSCDAKFVFSIGGDNQLRVWDAVEGNLALRPFPVPAGSIQLKISCDSRYVAVAGGQIMVFNLSELQTEPEIDLNQARQISVLLSNKTFQDGALVTLSSKQWLEKWQTYKRYANTR